MRDLRSAMRDQEPDEAQKLLLWGCMLLLMIWLLIWHFLFSGVKGS